MDTPATTTLADDAEIVGRILAHIDAGSTDEGPGWREPVANYVAPQRFSDELRLLRSLPSVFVPSAAIPNTGDHIDRVAFGVPLFAVRGPDHKARVFRNTCRHRGASLVDGQGCSRALVCRYHGWTYRLDGTLAHVPHQDGFGDLDPSSRGLVEVASRELDDIIVIDALDTVSAEAEPLLTDGGVWSEKLAPASQLFHVDSKLRAMNWKVLVEQFLEGYHIRTTHRQTFYPLQYDNLNVVETFGPNSRITFPYRNIERFRDRPRSTWTADRHLTYVYHLFPNAMLATFPDQVILVVIDPVDIDHTTVTTYSMATPAQLAAGTPAASGRPNAVEGGLTLIEEGALEDNEMSAAVQRGLRSGANTFLEFSRHESAIGHFHAALDERLAGLGGYFAPCAATAAAPAAAASGSR